MLFLTEYRVSVQGARGRRLSQSAIIIQSAFRCIAAKRQLRDARRAATKIQAAWRGKKGREAMLQVSAAISIGTKSLNAD